MPHITLEDQINHLRKQLAAEKEAHEELCRKADDRVIEIQSLGQRLLDEKARAEKAEEEIQVLNDALGHMRAAQDGWKRDRDEARAEVERLRDENPCTMSDHDPHRGGCCVEEQNRLHEEIERLRGAASRSDTITLPFRPSDDAELTCIVCSRQAVDLEIDCGQTGGRAVHGLHRRCMDRAQFVTRARASRSDEELAREFGRRWLQAHVNDNEHAPRIKEALATLIAAVRASERALIAQRAFDMTEFYQHKPDGITALEDLRRSLGAPKQGSATPEWAQRASANPHAAEVRAVVEAARSIRKGDDGRCFLKLYAALDALDAAEHR